MAMTTKSSTKVLGQLLLFHMRKDLDHPGNTFFVGPDNATDHIDRKGGMFAGVAWKAFGSRLVVVRCEHDLPHAVLAIGTTGRFARGLDGWQKQSDEHSDNGDDDQEFDQGKASVHCRASVHWGMSRVLPSAGPSRQNRIGHCQTPKEKGHTKEKDKGV